MARSSLIASVAERYAARIVNAPEVLTSRELEAREEKRQEWKRDLSGRANGTIDPFYGCFLFDEILDYAANFSFPWSAYIAAVCCLRLMLSTLASQL